MNTDANGYSKMFVLKYGDTNMVPSTRNGEGHLNADYVERIRQSLTTYQISASDPYHSFDLYALGPCGMYPYGFVETSPYRFVGDDHHQDVSPCFFLKLNDSILDWVPRPIDEDDLYKLPSALRDHWQMQRDKDNVWVNCEGKNAADKEALQDIEYFPASRGFPVKYFPYTGGSEYGQYYHAPLVAVRIKVGMYNVGQICQVECRAYAKYTVTTSEQIGKVTFSVLIKDMVGYSSAGLDIVPTRFIYFLTSTLISYLKM